ncbi:MAG: hypothetical protein EOP84_06650 [Verrucomicrobiaceae bacterium]|nr:MAG: hypothetical protein EOP84_06650 [Verrucomicrobiaceae bacterium]
MVKLRPYLCALGVLTTSATLAQNANSPAPAAPPIPAPVTPGAVAPIVPAPIDPPIIESSAQQTVAPIDPASTGAVPGVIDPAMEGATLSPTASRLNEFQGDDIGLVLRTLARQAKMNIVVSEKVLGTVTLRLEDRTPAEAIAVIVQAKGLMMDEVSGVYFIKTPEERAKEPTESASYTFAYASAERAMPLLQAQLQSGLAPQFDVRTNTIFYREAKSNLAAILLFLETIDRPTEQVMIEARLVEVTANPQQNYGINWNGVFGGTSVQYGSGTTTVAPGTPPTPGAAGAVGDLLFSGSGSNFLSAAAGQFAILSVPQLAATLSFLNADRDAEFLANPRVVTANNQKAEIKITRAQPVPQLNFNEQTAQAVFSGFQDKEFGNTLIVTPTINRDNFISMIVKPEISNKVGDAEFEFGGATVSSPIIDKRTLESNVVIKSGDTLAIGGLLQDETIKGRSKVPVLGDIPVVGYLFQERVNTRQKRNLLVFVTPTVLKPGYGTGLEDQVSGLRHSGDEYADPNGWRNNARGAARLVPTSHRPVAADYPKPGIAPVPAKTGTRVRKEVRSTRK